MNHSLPLGARDLAIGAARDAGTLLRDALGQHRDIAFKGLVDLVTDADRASEAMIAARIRQSFPEHGLLGEEGTRATDPRPDSSFRWVFDPLDGTTNYAHGYPHFAVSIALVEGDRALLGVVYDPMRDELFVAERGRGATLNGRPLRVSRTNDLIRSLLATGFAYDLDARAENMRMWDALLNITQGTRRDGSASLNLCYVAAGRLDGFWERPLQPWDIAAGALIVEEAGGRVSSYTGGRFDPLGHEAVATNGLIHDQLLRVVAQHALPHAGADDEGGS